MNSNRKPVTDHSSKNRSHHGEKAGSSSFRRKSSRIEKTSVSLDIIYQDEYFCVVDKPAGMPSQTKKDEIDVLTAVSDLTGKKKDQLHLINRLDQPVRGLMLVASASNIHAMFEKMRINNKLEKTYFAVISANPKDSKGVLNDELLRDSRQNISRVVSEKTRRSRTAKLHWFKLATVSSENGAVLSLLRIVLETGRHHQIRVQLANAGWPIWGDRKYGNNDYSPYSNNIALISQRLRFPHPISNEQLDFAIKLPVEVPYYSFKEYCNNI